MAGALAQLVQLDADAAKRLWFHCLVVLRCFMDGSICFARANELFAEDVVMDQYEALFAELEQRRLAAPPEAGRARAMPASLDPVQAFQGYPSHPSQPSASKTTASELVEMLPKSLCEARAPLWRLLDESVPTCLKGDLHSDLLMKHSVLP